MEKAFNCVNHDILLSTLEFYRVRGKINDLIKSYLKNRYHRVLIESKDSSPSMFSNWGHVKHGVPQGSILKPLLFLFYINNFPKIIKISSTPVLLAADISCIITNPIYLHLKKDITIAFVQLNK
jgi:hypothetical protein